MKSLLRIKGCREFIFYMNPNFTSSIKEFVIWALNRTNNWCNITHPIRFFKARRDLCNIHPKKKKRDHFHLLDRSDTIIYLKKNWCLVIPPWSSWEHIVEIKSMVNSSGDRWCTWKFFSRVQDLLKKRRRSATIIEEVHNGFAKRKDYCSVFFCWELF